MREERLREFRREQPRIYDRMKREAFEAHSKKSVLAFESFVREYRETHDGALPDWSKDIFEREEDVLQLPYSRATKKNKDFDNNFENDDEQKCGFEALRKILEASERAFPTTTTTIPSNTHDDDATQTTTTIDEINRERRNTHFSERAENERLKKTS